MSAQAPIRAWLSTSEFTPRPEQVAKLLTPLIRAARALPAGAGIY